MTQLTPAMDSELAKSYFTAFGAVTISLPSYTIRIIDGSGVVSYGGNTFTGGDATYGTLDSIDDLTDGGSDEAPAIRLTFHPAGDAAAADLAKPTYQGSPVIIEMGLVNPNTGQVIPDPYLLFLGELDVPKLRVGRNSRLLEFEVVSAFERFFEVDDGARLSDSFHKTIWPGELGLQHVTGVEGAVYWGMEAPPGAVQYGPGSYGGNILPGIRFGGAFL